jgi:hypothetical protein
MKIVLIIGIVLVLLYLLNSNFKINNKKKLKFIHITKTAGTTIEDIGKKHGLKWGRFDKKQIYKKNTVSAAFWHKPFTELDDSYKRKYDWFVVVRNPYTRILSEYYCNFAGFSNKKLSYEQINKRLINNIKNIDNNDGHYIQQYRYVDNSVKIHIVKFENIEEEFNSLMKEYNLDIVLDKHNNAGKKQKHFNIKDFSEELIDTINTVYDKDFKLFGYKKM